MGVDCKVLFNTATSLKLFFKNLGIQKNQLTYSWVVSVTGDSKVHSNIVKVSVLYKNTLTKGEHIQQRFRREATERSHQ